MHSFKAHIPFKLFQVCAGFVLGVLAFSAQASQDYGFTVLGPENVAVLRWVTASSQCPAVTWHSGKRQALEVRAEKAVVAPRPDAAQKDTQASDFQLTSCEVTWPQNEASATIDGRVFHAPKHQFRRIVLMGDTGCRLKGSENAFQDCSNPKDWTYATNVQHALAQHPDLVIHLGDIHYRESPCPASMGCRDSAWGYGSDAWVQDFFEPASPLLKQAPWVFVRGNHEACNRAGQGWFRFIDPRPLDPQGTCDRIENDARGNFTAPYLVHINKALSFVIFDSAAIAGKKLAPESAEYKAYSNHMDWVGKATKREGTFAFLSHHPVYGMAYEKPEHRVTPVGNPNLATWFSELSHETLAPDHTHWLMHGHIHTFEAIGYEEKPFSTFILGNSGSQIEGVVPPSVPEKFEISAGLKVATYYASPKYGFAVLDIKPGAHPTYTLTEFDTAGSVTLTCDLSVAPVSCQKPLSHKKVH